MVFAKALSLSRTYIYIYISIDFFYIYIKCDTAHRRTSEAVLYKSIMQGSILGSTQAAAVAGASTEFLLT